MQTYTALEHRPGDTPQLYDIDGGLVAQNADGKVVLYWGTVLRQRAALVMLPS